MLLDSYLLSSWSKEIINLKLFNISILVNGFVKFNIAP